jgi:hypothetical protein
VTNQEGYALRHTSPTPRKARYVRVVTGAASYCPPGVTAPCSMFNEIELYAADVDSFENDPVNGVPRGYSVDYTVDDQGRVTGGLGHDVHGRQRQQSRAVHHRRSRPAPARGPADRLVQRGQDPGVPVPPREVAAGQGAPSSFMFGLLATPGERPAPHGVPPVGLERRHRPVPRRQRLAHDRFRTCADPSTTAWSIIKISATTTQATVDRQRRSDRKSVPRRQRHQRHDRSPVLREQHDRHQRDVHRGRRPHQQQLRHREEAAAPLRGVSPRAVITNDLRGPSTAPPASATEAFKREQLDEMA